MYMFAIIDVYSRRIVGWSISNTMSMEWCREILSDAIRAEGQPEIFNTDQGSQFTSPNFVNPLVDKGIKVSMRTPRGMEKGEHLTMFFGAARRSNVFGGRLNKNTCI
jgi:putative transposase